MKILLLIFAIYLVACTILYFFQEKLIFYPEVLPEDYPFAEFPNAEEHFLSPDEHTRLNALHFKSDNGRSRGIVLYFHGNARALDDWGHRASHLTQLGYDVFMADYRGYGKSKGYFSENGFHEDALYLYQQLSKKYIPEEIVLYGCSLGSGIASRLATKVESRLLILETPYMSLEAVARSKFPVLPLSALLKYKFRNDIYIREVKCPVHIFHGPDDELIPYSQAVSLAKLSGKDNVLTTIEKGTHNDLPQFEAYHLSLQQLLITN